DGAASNIEPSVHRDLGDWIWSSIDTEVRLTGHLDFNAEHSFLSKGRDRYAGTELGTNTDEQLQETRVGFLYRLGTASVRDGVVNRWATAFDFTYPWIGRNATDASRAS